MIFSEEQMELLRALDDVVRSILMGDADSDPIDLVNEMFDTVFGYNELEWMRHCVIQRAISVYFDASERDVHKWFKQEYKNILGHGYDIIKKANNAKHIPDFWLSFGGEEIPVECKLNKFDSKALSQLKRYMDFYGSNQGIAVASTLAVDLPYNIKFIKYGEVKKFEGSAEVHP